MLQADIKGCQNCIGLEVYPGRRTLGGLAVLRSHPKLTSRLRFHRIILFNHTYLIIMSR